MDHSWHELVDYAFIEGKQDWTEYWKTAQSNRDKVTKQIDHIADSIRERLKRFDALQS
jgi:hypothetical protein